MSDILYHCGRCGSFFNSEDGHDEQRVCSDCHQRPGTGLWPSNGDMGRVAKLGAVAVFTKKGEVMNDRERDPVRLKLLKNPMFRIVVLWAVLMSLAIWRYHRRAGFEEERQNRAPRDAYLADGTLADERVAMLNSALPQCYHALAGFLNAGTPEARNQFVADPIGKAGRMAAFYSLNPFPRVDVKRLRRIDQELLKVGDEWMIGTRWQEGDDGAIYDAVFRRESGVWMLDWDHFSRFSEYPWVLFIAGDGPEKAEFRLLARKVTGVDVSDRGNSGLRFALHSPLSGKALGKGNAPVFVLDRGSDVGLLLQAAFDANHVGKHLFGYKMEPLGPEGLIRVRVVVKRIESGGVMRFEVEKVIACHWMDSDEPGFDLEKLKDESFGGI